MGFVTVQFRVKACTRVGCSAFSAYRSIMRNSGQELLRAKSTDSATDDQE